jgi:hypothetical protein
MRDTAMSATAPDDALFAAVRISSPETRRRLLHELLAEYTRPDGPWPAPVADRYREVVAFLVPRAGHPTGSPPKLSPEREAEFAERMGGLDDSRDLRDYIATLDSPGGSS